MSDLWLNARHDFVQGAGSLRSLVPLIGAASQAADRAQLASLVEAVAVSQLAMIELLTTLAHLENGTKVPLPMQVDLSDLVERSCSELSALAVSRGMPLVKGACPGSCRIDDQLVGEALRGVILSALKLASPGAIDVSAAIDATGAATFEITYSGIEPTQALARSAFVELAPVPDAPTAPFVGLGLAFVQRLARALGAVLETTPGSTAGSHVVALRFAVGV